MIGPDEIIGKFEKYEKVIYDYCRSRIDTYFDSPCFRILCNRMERLDNSIDMKSGKLKNMWNSKIHIPYGHEAYLMTRAVLKKSFSADPLISLSPIHETPWENANDAQDTLAQNFKSTRFRDLAFAKIIKQVARYGSIPVLSYFEHRPASFKKTMNGPFGVEQRMVTEIRQNVWNDALDPRNYFQNPDIAEPEASDYKGYIQRWNVSKLMGLVESMPENYIKKNIKKVIEQAKVSVGQNGHYHAAQPQDYHAHTTDIEHIYTTLNFEGNEEDETIYYLEIAGDNIIRIQDNPNDYNITTLTVYGLDKRAEYWWANSPVEKTFSTENAANILMSMTADNIFRASQNLIFYPKGKIDTAAIDDRHKNGGFVPVDAEILREFKTPLFPWQRQEISAAAVQYLMGELKEANQRTQAKPDVQRKGVAGGPQNATATAYQGMQAEADTLQWDYLSEFAVGLKDMGRVNMILLQQRLPDKLRVRPNPKEAARVLQKLNILGDYEYQVESSLTKNDQYELMRHQNALTWIMNMKGTGEQAYQRINIEKLVRLTMKKFDLDVDMDEVYPEQAAGNEAMMQGMPGASVAVPAQISATPVNAQLQLAGAA